MVCRTCGQNKETSEFGWLNIKQGKRQARCRECFRKYHRMWWQKYKHNRTITPEQIKEWRNRKIQRARAFVLAYLKSHPCSKCGFTNVAALDFHHVTDEPYNKWTRVSKLIQRSYSTERISKEIAKCIVLCANCHRIETAKKQGWYKSE